MPWAAALFAAAIFWAPALYGSQQNHHACTQLYEEAPLSGPGRWHAFIDEDNYLYVVSRCEIARHGAHPQSRASVNWFGLVVYPSLIVSAWFAAAALTRRVPVRRALTVIATIVLVCAATTAAWFAGAPAINL